MFFLSSLQVFLSLPRLSIPLFSSILFCLPSFFYEDLFCSLRHDANLLRHIMIIVKSFSSPSIAYFPSGSIPSSICFPDAFFYIFLFVCFYALLSPPPFPFFSYLTLLVWEKEILELFAERFFFRVVFKLEFVTVLPSCAEEVFVLVGALCSQHNYECFLLRNPVLFFISLLLFWSILNIGLSNSEIAFLRYLCQLARSPAWFWW